MISFDLRCAGDHVFEVWFRSSADYEDQRRRRLVICPVCADTDISKAVMAPAVAAKGNRSAAVPAMPAPSAPADRPVAAMTGGGAVPPELAAALATIARMQAEALPSSRWVGRDFARIARDLHACPDDGATQTIHGQATADEAEALAEDGIAVMPLLVPFVPPEAQN